MKWIGRAARWAAAEDGPTAVEYCALLALLIGVALVAIALLGVGNAARWQINAHEIIDALTPATR